MRCPDCGTPVADHHSYCRKCGTELPDVGGAATDRRPEPGGRERSRGAPARGHPGGTDWERPSTRDGDEGPRWRNCFFTRGRMPPDANPSRRGTVYVTDREVVCGFAFEYAGEVIADDAGDGPSPLVGLQTAVDRDRTVRIPLTDIENVTVLRSVPESDRWDVVLTPFDGEAAWIRVGETPRVAGAKKPAQVVAGWIIQAAEQRDHSPELGGRGKE